VGGLETIHEDVRVISATNRNLEQVVADGTLREDLYYRLNVIPIEVPPLRERRDDIPVLAEHFLKRCAHGLGKRLEGFDPEAMDALVNAPWRGNVRELENIIERASVLTEHDRITVDDLPSDLQPAPDGAPRRTVQGKGSLYDFERQLMLDALDDTGWNISAAARRLKIPRHHLRYRMQKWGIEKPGKS
jgi:DNA-binding NtrC family response regulator